MPKFSQDDVMVWGIGCATVLFFVCIVLAAYLFYDTAVKKPEAVVPVQKPELLSASEVNDAIRVLDARQNALNTLLGK